MRLLLSFFIIFAGCSLTKTKNNHVKKVTIKVERVRLKVWRVTYLLPEKVTEVKFVRQTNQFRQDEWSVKNPDLKIGKINGKEKLFSKSKTPFNEFTVEFPPYLKHTPKDYEFFQPYSDGGILFYTGHLYVKPWDATNRKEEWNTEVIISPIGNGNIVVEGKVSDRQVIWKDKYSRGTYIYFGNLDPIETNSVIAVIDSGLPKWVKDAMDDFLPKLFELYANKIDQELTFKPIVYFNYKPVKMNGTKSSGGTLPGIVQLTIEGTKWEIKDEDTLESVIWFLAHEAAHFWNGQMFDNIDEKAAWLHEGGADAFAYNSLYDLKVTSEKRLLKNYDEALNLCLIGLEGKSLNSSGEARKFKNFYSCGSVIMHFVDTALKRDREKELFSFWKDLLEESKSKDQKYDREDFHRLLSKNFKQKELSNLISDLELKDLPDQDKLFEKMAKNVGLKMKLNNKNASRSFVHMMNHNFLSEVMKADCENSTNISTQDKGYLLIGSDKCKTLKAGQYYVRTLEGISLSSKNGYKPILAAQKTCNALGTVTLGLNMNKKILKIKCPKVLNIFPWYELR